MTEGQKKIVIIYPLPLHLCKGETILKGASGQAASYSFLKCIGNEALEISASFYLFSLSLFEIGGF